MFGQQHGPMTALGGMPSLTGGALENFQKFGLAALTGAQGSEMGSFGYGPLTHPMAPRPLVEATAQMMFPAASFFRPAIDATLYDISALTDRERLALSKRKAAPGQILVAHPQGVRSPALYHTVGEFAISVDGQSRVAAIIGPGATLIGVAAFARDVANAIGEPVVSPIPSFTPADIASGLSGAFLRCDPGDMAGADGLRPEEQTLLDLMTHKPFVFRLVASHGLGARAMARSLFAEVEQARRRGAHPPDYSRHLVCFGAAPRLPARFEATRIIGAADPVGWSLADSAIEIDAAPFGVGHHTNTQLPGALSVSGILSKIEDLTARPATGGRRRVDAQTASMHD